MLPYTNLCTECNSCEKTDAPSCRSRATRHAIKSPFVNMAAIQRGDASCATSQVSGGVRSPYTACECSAPVRIPPGLRPVLLVTPGNSNHVHRQQSAVHLPSMTTVGGQRHTVVPTQLGMAAQTTDAPRQSVSTPVHIKLPPAATLLNPEDA
jgi:hypothetical protein